jgi:hypothetical protein
MGDAAGFTPGCGLAGENNELQPVLDKANAISRAPHLPESSALCPMSPIRPLDYESPRKLRHASLHVFGPL